jgi:hypothetical protein
MKELDEVRKHLTRNISNEKCKLKKNCRHLRKMESFNAQPQAQFSW